MILELSIVTGPVEVALRDGLPVGGITFLLGNDLAGDKVTSRAPNPIIMKVPRIEEDEGLAKLYPGMFSSCVVTRAMAKKMVDNTCTGDVRDHTLVDLSETFLCEPDSMSPETFLPVVESEHVNADGDAGDCTSVGDSESVETPELTLPLDTLKVSAGEGCFFVTPSC